MNYVTHFYKILLYDQTYLLNDNFFTNFFLERKLVVSKLNDFLKLRQNIVIIKPIQNSNPAKANKKKDVDVKIKSSFIVPTTVV